MIDIKILMLREMPQHYIETETDTLMRQNIGLQNCGRFGPPVQKKFINQYNLKIDGYYLQRLYTYDISNYKKLKCTPLFVPFQNRTAYNFEHLKINYDVQ